MRRIRYDLPPRGPVAGYPCYFRTETLGLTKEHMQQAAGICGDYENLQLQLHTTMILVSTVRKSCWMLNSTRIYSWTIIILRVSSRFFPLWKHSHQNSPFSGTKN